MAAQNLKKDGEVIASVSDVKLPNGFGEPTITRPEFLYTSAKGGTIVARLAMPVGPLVIDLAVWKGKDGKIAIRLPQYVACKSDETLLALDKGLRDRLVIWAKSAPPMPTQTRGAGGSNTAADAIEGL